MVPQISIAPWARILAACTLLIASPVFATTQCTALIQKDFSSIPDAPTQLTGAQPVSDGALPDYCRVSGYVTPAVGFELRIPLQGWNQRLLFQGCGGFCGTLRQIEDCNDALLRGYACITTNLGHVGTPLDGKWAYNNRPAEIDFYFRATHVTALAGKAIVTEFSGEQPRYSYLRGCSTGGRQGLISAQRFPEDFDGVIAGAPAGVSPGGGLHLIWSALANRAPDGQPILSEAGVDTVRRAVLAECDESDGLADGVLNDPRQCRFDPGTLACGTTASDTCLSTDQVKVVRKIYSGATTSDGQAACRAVPMPGSEPQWVPAYVRDHGPPIYYLFGGDFFRYLGFDTDPGPGWRPEDFDMQRDLPRLRFMRMLNYAANPDLGAYRERGGKIIAYQGWGDESVPPLGRVDYLELAATTMGGADQLSETMRLFMLPGVAHCRGGAGADTTDLLSHLENWVERGAAPDRLIVSRLQNRRSKAAFPAYPLNEQEVEFQRPVYPYPRIAVYKGSGDPDNPTSFESASPAR